MARQLTLYTLLIAAVALQMVLMMRFAWVPDIMLIMVVFAGMFRGGLDGIFVGLAAGIIRGLFSADTLILDLVLFPAVGLSTAALTKLFYRQNIANQVFMTIVAAAFVISSQTAYLNVLSGNDVSVISVAAGSWKAILATTVISPFIFSYLRMLWREED